MLLLSQQRSHFFQPVTCRLSPFYDLALADSSNAVNAAGEVCLSPGMACNDTCAIWNDSRRNLRWRNSYFQRERRSPRSREFKLPPLSGLARARARRQRLGVVVVAAAVVVGEGAKY